MIQVLEDDQEGDLTLYEMSPAQPILPVIVEAVPIDEATNTYKIQITHIQATAIADPEVLTSEVTKVQQEVQVETSEEAVEAAAPTAQRKRRSSRRCSKSAHPQLTPESQATEAAADGNTQPAPHSSDLLACVVCGRNFVSTERLQSHEKTHTKSRPFKCIDCGKTFTVRYSLICHTRVHTRERPYSCNVCGSRFSQASSLKTHQIYKHTKEFPYACRFCGRGFISPGQRHEHVNRSHSKGGASPTCKRKSKKSKSASSPAVVATDTETPAMMSACVQTNLSLPPGNEY